MAQHVRLHPQVEPRLKELPNAIQSQFGIPTDQSEIVAALIHGITLGQLAGMLGVYSRYTASLRGAGPPKYQEPPPID